uniref:SDR family NAD(P)-dependent oxidoreductase n=1 Tax=Stappia sp. TaxID=1870903 RepID=UPI003BA95A0B
MSGRFDLAGRTAVVTGASSGLGAHFARVLGREGARVALVARRAGRLAESADSLAAEGIESSTHVADVTDRSSLEAAFDEIVDRHGGIDILVNNAGIARPRSFLKMEEDDWNTVIDTDLSGVWRTAQVAARHMAERGRGGSIVNIASVLGLVVQPTQVNYAAAKAAVLHMTKAMARELGRHDIRVNAIAPGYFRTEINADFFETEKGKALVERLFPGRLGRHEELDGPLLLLASQAGSFMTGTTLVVDGGTILTDV